MIMRARHFTYLISIHAPLTGSDSRCRRYLYLSPHFNPRSPYGERQSTSRNSIVIEPFQSTLPLRGATFTVCSCFVFLFISIHAPLTGSDNDCRWCYFDASLFQSTLPLRGATTTVTSQFTALKFQSTLPLRGATLILKITQFSFKFQSTLPLRGATMAMAYKNVSVSISIHAPLTGSDGGLQPSPRLRTISIHAPLTGSDRVTFGARLQTNRFQSTLPLRGATRGSKCGCEQADISVSSAKI